VSDTFSAVDSSSDVGEAIEWQERIDQWPAIAGYKAVMDRLVRGVNPDPGDRVGPGA